MFIVFIFGFLVFIFEFLVFMLGAIGLVCQYHSQVIRWKELSCYVSSGTLNSTHSLTYSLTLLVINSTNNTSNQIHISTPPWVVASEAVG